MSVSFAQLGVPEYIIRALSRRGITEPFPIQAATIADALEGHDLCGRAPTGSGKTLAFGIPLVATVEEGTPRRPTGLVLAPTRELADQIADELRTFAGRARITTAYGGVGYGKQEKELRRGTDIVVGCPGRLEDLIDRGSLDLRDVEYVVVDEADRLADMGFFPAVRRLLQDTAEDRQIVLFSATLDGDVAKLTRDFQHNPITHEVGPKTPDITNADHQFWQIGRDDRVAATSQAVFDGGQAVVFCRTRRGADRLAKQLGRFGVRAGAIHGGHPQNRRTRTLGEFTDGKIQALIATDVAARGIHVDEVGTVIHFDPPEDHKAYVHRSGRTARAGAQGSVVSLVLPDQARSYRKLKSVLKIDAPFITPEFATAPAGDPVDNEKREPERDERGPRGKRNGRSSSNRSDNRPSNRSGGRPSGKKRPSKGGPKNRRDDDTRGSSARRGPKRPNRSSNGHRNRTKSGSGTH